MVWSQKKKFQLCYHNFLYFYLKKYFRIFSVASLERMATEKMKKNDNNYNCQLCDFTTCKKTNFEIHLHTQKHIRISQATSNIIEATTKMTKCENCNKIYRDRTGLWRHKKHCISTINIDNYNDSPVTIESSTKNDELINYLMKENQEFKNLILEIVKKDTYNNCNNTTTNSHNKSFNLNFFLNETCKDAMNIMDFVDSIKLQLSDLENVGKLGYVNGISNIIIKNLKELDVEKRPVHCTDKKRETMYVKDENKWEKDEKNSKISKAIKRVVSKNQRLIPKFKEAHPDCNTYHSKYNDQYNKLILESCGGSGDNDLEKEEKIIQNISKNVLVDK
jgi:hypothetical protein